MTKILNPQRTGMLRNQQSAIINLLCPHCQQPIALRLTDSDAALPAEELAARLARLPLRQCQVLSLLCEGLTIKQVAGRLGLHPRTVGLHIRGLKERFGAENIVQLAAVQSGKIAPPANKFVPPQTGGVSRAGRAEIGFSRWSSLRLLRRGRLAITSKNKEREAVWYPGKLQPCNRLQVNGYLSSAFQPLTTRSSGAAAPKVRPRTRLYFCSIC